MFTFERSVKSFTAHTELFYISKACWSAFETNVRSLDECDLSLFFCCFLLLFHLVIVLLFIHQRLNAINLLIHSKSIVDFIVSSKRSQNSCGSKNEIDSCHHLRLLIFFINYLVLLFVQLHCRKWNLARQTMFVFRWMLAIDIYRNRFDRPNKDQFESAENMNFSLSLGRNRTR